MKFYKTFCLTLEGDLSRQQSAQRRLEQMGITTFEFVYGVAAQSEDVREAYRTGYVKLYPPCFRCGEEECRCSNNVLIPSQVGNFLSYRRIWNLVAGIEDDHLVLIVEDDVCFTWYARFMRSRYSALLERLRERTSGRPLYVRLGWATCSDHRRIRIPKAREGVTRMSNPCFVINSAAARAFLRECDRIETTSDLFMDGVARRLMRNFTIFPPLACDLSWSKGVFESRIMMRSSFKGRSHNSDADVRSSGIAPTRRPVGRRAKTTLLGIIGHPRCGSGYMASFLKAMGYDVGHEAVGADGFSSWMHVVKDWYNPFGFDEFALSGFLVEPRVRILHTRNPRRALPSIVLENTVERSFSFRRLHILERRGIDLAAITCEWERALLSYLLWYDIALEAAPDLVCQIESPKDTLISQLKQAKLPPRQEAGIVPRDTNSAKLFNGKLVKKPSLGENTWIDLQSRKLISEYWHVIGRLGYSDI